MRFAFAIFASLMLVLSGISAHAAGTHGVGGGEQTQHQATQVSDCHHEDEQIGASASAQQDHESGCVAGACAMACGYFTPDEASFGNGQEHSRYGLLSDSQTAGRDLSFDPPPPRA